MLPTWLMLLLCLLAAIRYFVQFALYDQMYRGCLGNGAGKLAKLALGVAWLAQVAFYLVTLTAVVENVALMRSLSRDAMFVLAVSYIMHDHGAWRYLRGWVFDKAGWS